MKRQERCEEEESERKSLYHSFMIALFAVAILLALIAVVNGIEYIAASHAPEVTEVAYIDGNWYKVRRTGDVEKPYAKEKRIELISDSKKAWYYVLNEGETAEPKEIEKIFLLDNIDGFKMEVQPDGTILLKPKNDNEDNIDHESHQICATVPTNQNSDIAIITWKEVYAGLEAKKMLAFGKHNPFKRFSAGIIDTALYFFPFRGITRGVETVYSAAVGVVILNFLAYCFLFFFYKKNCGVKRRVQRMIWIMKKASELYEEECSQAKPEEDCAYESAEGFENFPSEGFSEYG